ncbi:MAG: hypothetical protein A3K13_13245 [Gemmatimonadetes bacterium RIFCSPLOWO2_12_FULL_68_9]|nr:MAG: hypothetical protein A3K13_13245 [Gemmatimonadetes bacterium RIFCSPLOWO2_12_FULL_68_9]
MDLDDVIEGGALEARLDFVDGGAQRLAAAGARGALRVAGEELQFRGARRKGGELHGQPLHRARGRRLLEPHLEGCGEAMLVRRGILERDVDQPRGTLLEDRARADRVYPPPRAARRLERALDQLVNRVGQDHAIRDGRREVQLGGNGLGHFAARDRIGDQPRGQTPHQPSQAAELRCHRRFRQRGEVAQRLEAELVEAAVGVGIQRQGGHRLRGEELVPPLVRDHHELTGFGSRRSDPRRELSPAPTQTVGWSGGRVVGRGRPSIHCSHDLRDHPFRWAVQTLQPIHAHIGTTQLRRLDYRAHVAQRQQQVSELFVVPDGIRLQQNQRWAQADRLADRDAGPDPHAAGDR